MPKQFDAIALTPTFGGSIYGSNNYVDPVDAEIALTVRMSPVLPTDLLEIQLQDLPGATMAIRGHLEQVASLPDVGDAYPITKRLMPGVSLVMSTPCIVNGRPTSPAFWAQNVDTTYDLETGPNHIQSVNDPNPVWNTATNDWLVQPPLGGVGNMRWTVANFPEADDFPDDEAAVGARSTTDGTSTYPTALGRWYPDAATPNAPPWNSQYPYKPRLVNYEHINRDGSSVTFTKALQFSRHTAQHMWLDMGSLNYAQPFTWMMVAISQHSSQNNLRNYMLDGGSNPFNFLSNPTEDSVSLDYDIRGNQEGLSFRGHLSTDKQLMYAANKWDRNIHTKHAVTHRPKCYYGIFNGKKSVVGNITHGAHRYYKGKLFEDSSPSSGLGTYSYARYYVMGRRNGHIGIRYASDMVVFEVRFWVRALTGAELKAQYEQLSTTWKFSRFN